jgi:translocation and assembly module TamB
VVLVTLLFIAPALCVSVLMVAANTERGRAFIQRTTAALTANQVTLEGLGGRFPQQIQIGRISLQNATGVWLAVEHISLAWQPWRLLAGTADIDALEIGHIELAQLPPASAEQTPSKPFSLPLAVQLRRLHLARIDIAEAITGRAMRFGIDGHAQLTSFTQGEVVLSAQSLQDAGHYTLQAQLDKAAVHARLSVAEPAQGMLAKLAGVQEAQPLAVTATVDGALSALQSQFALDFGPLNAKLQGTVNAPDRSADLNITATAPAMQMRPDLAWQAIDWRGTVQGPINQPRVDSRLIINGLKIAQTHAQRIDMAIKGDAGRLDLSGTIHRLTRADSQQDILQAAPLKLQATVHLNTPTRPVTVAINHPLLNISGNGLTAVPLSAKLAINAPNLKPLAALAGLELAGSTALTVQIRQQAALTTVETDGFLSITGDTTPLAKLIGNQAKIGVTLTLQDADMGLPRFRLDGKTLKLQADGQLIAQQARLNWQMALDDLAAITTQATGKLDAHGQIAGPLNDFSVVADANGDRATATLKLEHLPNLPTGSLDARAVLAGAPLALALTTKPQQDHALHINIDRADWKSLHTQGSLALAKNASWPVGSVELRMARLDDLQPLLNKLPLSGSATATLNFGPHDVRLAAEARTAHLGDKLAVEVAALALTVENPLQQPQINGQLDLQGLTTGTITGSSQLALAGTPDSLALHLSAALDKVAGAPLNLDGDARLETANPQLKVSQLQADWRGETARLLAPATVQLGKAISVDRLRLGVRKTVFEAAGQFSPTLAMTARLQNVTADLLNIWRPDSEATGTLSMETQLRGSFTQPVGTLAINATDWRISGTQALPAAQLKATAELDGRRAQVQAQFNTGGQATLKVSGSVPLDTVAVLDLKAIGTLGLHLSDPLLAGSGRRLRGQVAINAGLAGTWAQPLFTGSAELSKVELRDHVIGANITDINGVITARGGQLVIDKLRGRAGKGTLTAQGTVDVLKDGLPVNLTLTAKDAKPLATDRLTVTLNSDLTVRGLATEKLTLAGDVLINRADIRIPEHLPAHVAVLKLQALGAPPPPPHESSLALNLIIAAPAQIFVRGRGLDAELSGNIAVHGTANTPQADGYFKLRRGQFTLAGKTLAFSKGTVGFDGGSLTDPSLNFVADTSSDNITATLTITGTANKPKIILSSVPNLPQDEILARLLFNRSASSLSVLEMVQIGTAVASLTGGTSGIGDPLDSVRQQLQLDRLSVGGAKPALEAGRYVAPGIYLGTKQGIAGGTPQAVIQIDLSKHLKLESTVGASPSLNKGANPNSVGIIYQFDY